MKAKITRYLIPLLILTIIITFCSFSCSPPSPGNQTIEEPAQKTAEEITVEEPEDEPAEEEVIQTEPKEESTSEQKTKTIKETTDETIEANPTQLLNSAVFNPLGSPSIKNILIVLAILNIKLK